MNENKRKKYADDESKFSKKNDTGSQIAAFFLNFILEQAIAHKSRSHEVFVCTLSA